MTATVGRDRRATDASDAMPGPAARTSELSPTAATTASYRRPPATPHTNGAVDIVELNQPEFEQPDLEQPDLEQPDLKQRELEQPELGPVGPGQPGPGQLEQLRQVLAQQRTCRLQVEHDGAALEVLTRAVALVRQDRDAGTSPTLRRERALFEQVLGDVDELASLLARVSVRMSVLGLPADAPQLRAGLSAGHAGLAALAGLAAALNNSDPSSATGPLHDPPDEIGRAEATTPAQLAPAGPAGSAVPVPAGPDKPAKCPDTRGTP